MTNPSIPELMSDDDASEMFCCNAHSPNATCKGSCCMAWRYVEVASDLEPIGYCGWIPEPKE